MNGLLQAAKEHDLSKLLLQVQEERRKRDPVSHLSHFRTRYIPHDVRAARQTLTADALSTSHHNDTKIKEEIDDSNSGHCGTYNDHDGGDDDYRDSEDDNLGLGDHEAHNKNQDDYHDQSYNDDKTDDGNDDNNDVVDDEGDMNRHSIGNDSDNGTPGVHETGNSIERDDAGQIKDLGTITTICATRIAKDSLVVSLKLVSANDVRLQLQIHLNFSVVERSNSKYKTLRYIRDWSYAKNDVAEA